MKLEVGDLVLGKKPWNKDTHLGVVIGSDPEQPWPHVFRIFWLKKADKKKLQEKTCFSWEMPDSVTRIKNVRR